MLREAKIMKIKQCAICKKSGDLFSIVMTYEDEEWQSYVCGTCWEHIAEIAQRALKATFGRLGKSNY